MFTEAQFRAAFREHVEQETRAIPLRQQDDDDVVMLSIESPNQTTKGSWARATVLAAACALVATAGGLVWNHVTTDPPPPASSRDVTGDVSAHDDVAMATVVDPPGYFALLIAPLSVTDGCLSTTDGGILALDPAVWSWDPEAGELSNATSGATFRVGDPLEIVGGWVPLEAAPGLVLPESCADYQGRVFTGTD